MLQTSNHTTLFGNIQSGKLYKLPSGVTISACKDSLGYEVATNGLIYLGSMYIYNNSVTHQVYKLNPTDFSLKPMLPIGQDGYDFQVFNDEFILYYGTKVKCPGGKTIVLDMGEYEKGYNDYFVFNNTLISYEQDMKMYKWRKVDENNIEKEFLCDFYYTDNGVKKKFRNLRYNDGLLHNYVKNTLIIYSGEKINGKWTSQCFEFDENAGITKIEHLTNEFLYDIKTINALWEYDYFDKKFTILNLKTYAQTEFPSQISDAEYDIYRYLPSKGSVNLGFSALRFSDSKNVMGTITPTGTFTIDKVEESDDRIVNMIPIN